MSSYNFVEHSLEPPCQPHQNFLQANLRAQENFLCSVTLHSINPKPWHNKNLKHLSVHVKRSIYKALYWVMLGAKDSRIDVLGVVNLSYFS